MGNIRKKYDATLKAKIALEAVKGEKTIAEISSEYGVHSTQIAHWKKQLLEELPWTCPGLKYTLLRTAPGLTESKFLERMDS